VRDVSLLAIADEAGIARATLYRHFPKGRDELVTALVHHEVNRFFGQLYVEVEGLTRLDDVLERGLRFAHRTVSSHFLLQSALRDDPGALEPGLSSSLQPIGRGVTELFATYLPDTPDRMARADFLARMAIEYISTPGRWDFEDDHQLHQLVHDELLAPLRRPPYDFAPFSVRPLPKSTDTSLRTRVVNATLHEFALGHYDDLSLAVVAEQAQTSRATLYRAFPGGRDAIVRAAIERETSRLYTSVAEAVGMSSSLHESLIAGMTTIWDHLESHEAVQGILKCSPEVLLRQLRFDAATATYEVTSSLVRPLLTQWVDGENAARVAEWVSRVVVSYWVNPSVHLDVSDPESVASFYGHHMAAGVDALVPG